MMHIAHPAYHCVINVIPLIKLRSELTEDTVISLQQINEIH